MQPELHLADYFALIGAGYAQSQSLHDDLGSSLATLDLYKSLWRPAASSHKTICDGFNASPDLGAGSWYIGILQRLAQDKYEREAVWNWYPDFSHGPSSGIQIQLDLAYPFTPLPADSFAGHTYISPPLDSSSYFTQPSACLYLAGRLRPSEESVVGAEVLAAVEAQRFVRSWTEIARYRGIVRYAVELARSIRRILHFGIALFCSVSWERRTWFLLHGSHPPKVSLLPYSTGCAVPAM
jgi:hypothetical protein